MELQFIFFLAVVVLNTCKQKWAEVWMKDDLDSIQMLQ